IGIRHYEIDALQAGGDHVVDGVAAGAADAEHGDARLELTDVGDSQIDGHLPASSLMRGRRRRPAPADPPPAVVMSRVTSRLRNLGVIRNSREAIVRRGRNNCPCQSSGTAYRAFRSARDAPLAG